LINITRKENLPTLVKSKDELINELKSRRYSNENIECEIQMSRYR
jgi:hypothetical protein